MQNKTQVIPIPGSDFVHTRLTHSLETFCVGRSLGQEIGKEICNKGEFGVDPEDIASIVATACIAHDIGNPPLGHTGEDIISEFFKYRGEKYIKDLAGKFQMDLTNFDGNALGFHILSHSLPGHTSIEGGLRLTYTALATFMKYPNDSSISSRYKQREKHKFGIFQSEVETYKAIAEKLRLERDVDVNNQWCRHPLAFLVEAADDICYHIIDFEDAYRMNLVNFKTVKDRFSNIEAVDNKRLKLIKDDGEKIGYLRSRAINSLIQQVSRCFVDNIDQIIKGEHSTPLIDTIESSVILKDILAITLKCMYNKRTVTETETAGFEYIQGLLDTFISAVVSEEKLAYHKKIISLIPSQFLNNKGLPSNDPYSDILNITHFIAGMTDTYAIDTYRLIKGIDLPNY